MKKNCLNMAILATVLLSACVEIQQEPMPEVSYAPICKQETTVVVYENGEEYLVPGCVDFEEVSTYVVAENEYAVPISTENQTQAEIAQQNAKVAEQKETVKTENVKAEPQKEKNKKKIKRVKKIKTIKKLKKGNIYEPEVDTDEIAGEFPIVENNKYYTGTQVVLQNLETRVLAYCRGSAEDIEACVEKMECSGYTRITEVPYMSAKYDKLKKGTYPTRRWRNGESVPRW